jgi:hypothetical protein
MLIGRTWSGTGRQALRRMCVSRFPNIPGRMTATRQVRQQSIPFARHSRPSVPTRPRLPRGMRPYGRAGRAGRWLLRRRGWSSPIGRCCCSPARSKHCETHQLWLGTGLQQVSFKNRTWCGRGIKPGAWPAKSTRRSSSAWAVPETRPRPWPEPCRALSGERVTGNQLRCTATRPSPSIRSSARSVCSGSDSLPRSLAHVALQLTEICRGSVVGLQAVELSWLLVSCPGRRLTECIPASPSSTATVTAWTATWQA